MDSLLYHLPEKVVTFVELNLSIFPKSDLYDIDVELHVSIADINLIVPSWSNVLC